MAEECIARAHLRHRRRGTAGEGDLPIRRSRLGRRMSYRPLGDNAAGSDARNAHHPRCGARSRAPERGRSNLPRASARGGRDPGRFPRPRAQCLRRSHLCGCLDPFAGRSRFPRPPLLQRSPTADLRRCRRGSRDRGINAGYEIESGCGRAEWFRDAVLGAGRPCLTIATDDSHDGPDCLNAWTMIRAAERSREGVVEALREGHFYASAGPTIHEARREGDALEVRCSPVRSVRLRTVPYFSTSVSIENPSRSGRVLKTDSAGLITEAE